MKSYFLEHIKKQTLIELELSKVLPGQSNPWVLIIDGDAYAYFNVEDYSGDLIIQADVSGRHYDSDEVVLSIFKKIQSKIGGEITNDL